MPNQPEANNWPRWFDPRSRSLGTFGFILNRVTALGLTLYLLMHLVALGQLAKGADAYDGFIALVKNPLFKLGELLVIAAGVIHGLNGIRIALNSFGIGVRRQRSTFIALMAVSVLVIAFFAYKMFSEG
jgi:succinate dehydrogenase / fumarate reductase cytochrome b subunit